MKKNKYLSIPGSVRGMNPDSGYLDGVVRHGLQD